MKRIYYKTILIIFFPFVFLLCPVSFFGFEESIILGREDNWNDFVSFSEIIMKKGKWDTFDLTLKDAQGIVTSASDLLLHFDTSNIADETGNYKVSGKNIMISHKNPVFGTGCGLFERDKYTLSLIPSPGSFFAPGTLWGDFTIQFWMQPVTMCDSEIILSWNGSRQSGSLIQNQSLHCTLNKRTCTWEFKNFFLPESEKENVVILKGLTPLLPGEWHHHMIRYDSTLGIVEYLVDGIPEAVLYTTEENKEDESVYLPFIGGIFSSDLKIGEYYTGLLDEFSLSGDFVQKGVSRKYEGVVGRGMSKVFDIRHTGSLLKSITAQYTKPDQTEIYFYYRMADTVHLWNDLGGEWIQFEPGQIFVPGEGTRGRYIQLLVELFPDGNESIAPRLSSITITYEPDFPPPPPPDVFAVAGNTTVTLYWKKVNYRDVAGYLIYFGDRPGQYFWNTRSDQGTSSSKEFTSGEKSPLTEKKVSPIDVGNVTEYEITELENGKIYYFAVVAYDSSDIPHQSIFSKEVHARPSGLYK